MKTAIYIGNPGMQYEVSAAEFNNATIRVSAKQFICSECNEFLALNKLGYFQHSKRKPFSLDCEKRVESKSDSSFYERNGIPIYLRRITEKSFGIYIGFPPPSSKELDNLKSNKNALNIIGSRHDNLSIRIDRSNFFTDQKTYFQLRFIPNDGKNYMIEYDVGKHKEDFEKLWSKYADGFSPYGSFFEYSDNFSRKIRRGDAISLDRTYLLMTTQYKLHRMIDKYKELIGVVTCGSRKFNLFKIEFGLCKLNSLEFESLNDHIIGKYDVSIKHKKSQLIPIWPPCIKNGDHYTTFSDTHDLICMVSSDSENPNVYEHYKKRFNEVKKYEYKSKKFSEVFISKYMKPITVDRRFSSNYIYLDNNMSISGLKNKTYDVKFDSVIDMYDSPSVEVNSAMNLKIIQSNGTKFNNIVDVSNSEVMRLPINDQYDIYDIYQKSVYGDLVFLENIITPKKKVKGNNSKARDLEIDRRLYASSPVFLPNINAIRQYINNLTYIEKSKLFSQFRKGKLPYAVLSRIKKGMNND